MVEVTIWSPRRLLARKAPMMAILLDSVPPDVKIISSEKAPIAFAIISLASSIAFLGIRADEYNVEGFLKSSRKYGIIALNAFADNLVVAA